MKRFQRTLLVFHMLVVCRIRLDQTPNHGIQNRPF
jgi:hypothetical protein